MTSAQPQPEQPQPAGKMLHIGSGPKTKANIPIEFREYEETRLDIDESWSPDVVADMRDLSVFDEGSFDLVYSSHNIEHLYAHEVVPTLKEWRRVLKEGGRAVIRCPDVMAVCKAVTEKGLTASLYESPAGPITALDILYGHVASMQKGNLFMAHKTGFSKDSLQMALQQAGFSRGGIFEDPDAYELIVRAVK